MKTRECGLLAVIAVLMVMVLSLGVALEAQDTPPAPQPRVIVLDPLEQLIYAYGRAKAAQERINAEVQRLEIAIAVAKRPAPQPSAMPRLIGPTREEVLSKDERTSDTKTKKAPESKGRTVIRGATTFKGSGPLEGQPIRSLQGEVVMNDPVWRRPQKDEWLEFTGQTAILGDLDELADREPSDKED